jgi:hypothetical protein
MPYSQVGRLLRRKNPKKCSRKRITKDLKTKRVNRERGKGKKRKNPNKNKIEK